MVDSLTPRRAAVATLLLAGALTAASGCKKKDGDAEAAETAKAVVVSPQEIYVVSEHRIETGPSMSGSLDPDQEATVRAEVGGAVLQTFVDQGTHVGVGTVLARLDDTAIRDSYLSARSGVTAAQTAADAARRNLERSEKLATSRPRARRPRPRPRSSPTRRRDLPRPKSSSTRRPSSRRSPESSASAR